MKELKHTQGKWMIAKASKNRYEIVADIPYSGSMGTNNETMVCEVSYLEGFTRDQVEANAELIKSAPEMLKLLIDLTTKYNVMPNSKCGENENPFGDAAALIRKLTES
jgi:hypothetical protein